MSSIQSQAKGAPHERFLLLGQRRLRDAGKLADFWSQVLDRTVDEGASRGFRQHRHERRRAGAGAGQPVWMFHRVPEGKQVKNRVHVDFVTGGLQDEVERLLALGATHVRRCRRRRVPVGDAHRPREQRVRRGGRTPVTPRPTPRPTLRSHPSIRAPGGPSAATSPVGCRRGGLPAPGSGTRPSRRHAGFLDRGGGRGYRRHLGLDVRGGGTIRSSQRGIHQLARPSSSIIDGTSTMRTRVASTKTAVARPSPNTLRTRSGSPITNDPKTQTMMAAAAVMTRAVLASPSATAMRVVAACGATPPGSARAGTPRSPSTARTGS